MEKRKCRYSQILAWIIIVVGFLIASGWYFKLLWLVQFSPGFISMQFVTAVTFVFSGVVLLVMVKMLNRGAYFEFYLLLLPILSLIILLLMVSFILPLVLGLGKTIEPEFVLVLPGEPFSIGAGLPSAATVVNFILIAVIGLLRSSIYSSRIKLNLFLAGLIILISTIALVGYFLNVPQLFYYFPGRSSAMAITTAILFIAWGVGAYICLGVNHAAD